MTSFISSSKFGFPLAQSKYYKYNIYQNDVTFLHTPAIYC